VIEFVNNGHVDGLAVALVVAALIVAAGVPVELRRERRRDVLFGLCIGAAALVKVYPAGLLVVAGCLPSARPRRSLLRASAAAGALTVAWYVPHALAAGLRVVGYLPGYLREEHYQEGSRFLLAGVVGLTGKAAAAAAALALGAVITWVLRRRPSPPAAAAVVLAALVLITTPVQPWYAVMLLAPAALVPWPAVAAAVVAAGYPYFFAVILDYAHTTALGRSCYAVAALTVLASRPRPERVYVARSGAMSMERQQ
jgi:hypothetical protein